MSGRVPDEEPTTTWDTTERVDRAFQVLVFGDGWSAVHDVDPTTKELVVGRESDCGVCIDERSVSRRHVALAFGATVTLRDLGSANGVEVDGTRVPKGGSVALRPGARVQLGAASLVVYGDAASGAAPLVEDDLEPGDPMSDVYGLCDQVASSDLSVLFLGETGTGKELLAERVHARSARAGGPFVRLNAATVPEALAESQLFGHERGAFTGATHPKDGLVMAAHRGTFFLDEIGDLAPPVQTKLLRVIETGTMFRVGSTAESTADVRYLAATSRDVGTLVASGGLRSDLVYRLAGVTVYVPPLRERPMAVLPLARSLLAAASAGRSSLSENAADALGVHTWPGNVRELKATMQRAAVLASFGRVEAKHLALGALRLSPRPAETAGSRAGATMPPPAAAVRDDPPRLREEIQAVERERILEALASCGGNQTRAAQMLGISRRTLGAKLDQINYARPRKSSR